MSVPEIRIERTTHPKDKPSNPDQLGFGRFFTDHMAVMDYDKATGWGPPRIVAYGPFEMDPSSAVFHYGQAMFEGMKAFRGQDGKVRLFRPDRHAHRLADGAHRLCMPRVDPETMQACLHALVGLDEAWVPSAPMTALYIRPTLIATDPMLGVRASTGYKFFIILSPVGAYYPDGFKPLKIWIEEHFVRAAPGGTGAVKSSSNYVGSLLASEQARVRGYAQVLWLDAKEHRYIEEVGTILGGITRDCVLTLLRDWGVKVTERHVSVDELEAAYKAGALKEVFGSGTASVIAPVGELGRGTGTMLINGGKVGELSSKLFDAITGIQYGKVPDKFHWLEEVRAPEAATQARRSPRRVAAAN